MDNEQELEVARELNRCKHNPLRYVMHFFPWKNNPTIQMVELPEEYKKRFPGYKYGPDRWACEFLDDLGSETKLRGFDGKTAVKPVRFATASGHGIGKSVMVAWLIKWILDTRPFSKIVVTANTSEQLRTKTWAELAKWHMMSLTRDKYHLTTGRGAMSLYRKGGKDIAANWRADAQTCREENSEAFQGLHAANATPAFIFDESSGIPDKIFEARSGAASDGEPMWFDFGNPTQKSGYFYENCVGEFAHRWKVRHIDSRDVAITNKELFQEWIDDYGIDSDFVKVKVRGIFPSAGSTQFILHGDVEEAMRRELMNDSNAPLIIGVDVARYGDNATVIFPRLGMDARSFPYREYRGLSTTQVTEKVIETIKEFQGLGKQCAGLYVDGGGLGAGPVDQLRQLGYNPIDVQFGGSASNRKYWRRGDEMWGRMREELRRLCLPRNSELKTQLTQREYGFMEGTSRIKLESKADMEKRGARSPDIADALALTFASTTQAEVDPALIRQGPQFAQSEFDPLEEGIYNGRRS